MTNSLLLVAWPYKDQVLTSFRYATQWVMPAEYVGKAKLTQIYSLVNNSMFEMVFRCQNCFSWNTDGGMVNVSTTKGQLVFGRALAAKGPDAPLCPSKIRFGFHDAGYSQYGANIVNLAQKSYSAYAAMATKVVSTNCANIPTATSTATGR